MVHRLQHTIDRALFKLTKKQPTKVLYITISCLSIGILFVLYNAFGARIPSPHDNNLRSSNNDFNLHEDVMADAKFNPYSFASSSSNNKSNQNHRLAIIIPYLPPNDGGTFPPYFDLFAQSAAGSSTDVDYLIFHCFIPQSLLPNVDTLPTNVKLIDLNEPTSEGSKNQCGLAKLFTRVTDERQSNNELAVPIETLITKLSHQIINLPYILVEYKPAFGHIFSSYLKEYTHWGYSDLDVVYGDISRWIDDDEWYNYDIVTYGFGDQDKLYLRGQFTFHRNDDKYINQLWRHCKYLSEMDIRYSNTKNIKFESAEGCYSQAVIQKKDIKVKWAVKAFTDVGENSPIYTHGVYLSLGSKPSLTTSRSYHPKSVLYTAADTKSGHALQSLPYNWFEDKSNYPKYIEEKLPIQKLVGERTKVQTYRTLYQQGELTKKDANEVKCMYWAPKTYQLDICTVNGNVKSDEVVVLEKGVLYKQKYVVRKKLFPEGIRSFPFFHFQEWKRIYRTTELLPSHNIRDSNTMSGLIITKEGVLPLMLPSSASSRWNFHLSQSDAWQSADTGSTPTHSSNTKFCLNSSPKGYPKGATTCNLAVSWPQPSEDTYTSTTSFGDSASVTVLRSPGGTDYHLNSKSTTVRGRLKRKHKPAWWNEKLIDANNDVTLTLTLQITSAHIREKTLVQNLLAVAESNIYVWGSRQPSVLLIQVDSSNDEEITYFKQTIQMIKDTVGTSSSDQSSPNTSHLKNCLVAIVDSSYEESAAVSRKALLNMATHAAPTRWIVSGLELERGLVLSREASIYALREARVYTDMPGHVLVIPQFASTRDDTRKDHANHVTPKDRLIFSSIGAELLPSIRGKQTMVSNLSEYDCLQCSVEEEEEEDIDPQDAEEEVDDGLDDGANRRRLSDGISTEKNVEELLEDLWWDLSVADVYGTPGGFNGEARTSVGAMAKIHGNIEMSLISLLDRSKSDHVEYLQYFDKSPILLIDRLGPKKEMMTLDLASEVEEFSGSKCFNLLRLAQLATLGYKVSVLPGVFAASYPNTRDKLCTKSFQDNSPPQQCECDLDSEGTVKEILIDEVKRSAKVAVLTNELDIVQATV